MAVVLIVGGAGYIGSHACKALAQQGHTPVVYDNLVYGHEDSVKWGKFEKGDILDSGRLDEVFQKHNPSHVMHFAAYAYVGESVTDPAKYYKNNVMGSINLLEAMRRNSIKNIIFSSTCATYGDVDTLPITEETPQAPINPYGQTKLMVEQALKDYSRAYGLKWVVFRYFNAAGCDPDGELGERHDPETHVIPLAIEAAIDQGSFKIFGTDYDTPDGTAIRDYIHVSDLAEAHCLGVDFLDRTQGNEAFNLATGNGVSVLQIVSAVNMAVGTDVPVELATRRAGDPPALYSVAHKAKNMLCWTPRFVNIRETVETAARWFKEQ